MPDVKELKQLQRLEAQWNNPSISSPNEIVRLNKQIRELKKRMQGN